MSLTAFSIGSVEKAFAVLSVVATISPVETEGGSLVH